MQSKFPKHLYLITGVILMVNLFGCSGVRFEKYSSKDPLINISMDYISGWQYDETRGSYGSYAQVIFFPFKEAQKPLRAMIAVTVKDSSKIGLSPVTLESVSDDLLTKRMQFEGAHVLSKRKTKFLQKDAMFIDLSYLAPENLRNINSKSIPVREKIIIFNKENNFYFLRYENTAEDFAKFNKAFSHCIKTLKFKDNR